MKSGMRKTILREISGSLGRFMAILAIVALGAGFFTGIRVSTPAMLDNANRYLDEADFFDFRLISTLGFTEEDVAAFSELDGIAAANGSIFTDVLCIYPGLDEFVLKAHSITEDMSHLSLYAGRMPEAADECVVDNQLFGEAAIGTTISISPNNPDDTVDLFAQDRYTIVGLVSSPMYLNYERGTSSLGSGSASGFIYFPQSAFDSDTFYEIYLTMEDGGFIYSENYKSAVAAMEDPVTQLAEQRADLRYTTIVTDAQTELDDAQKELDEGRATYLSEKAKAEAELADAWNTLSDAETQIINGKAELANGWHTFNTEIADGKQQLQDARTELDSSYETLSAAQAELDEARQTLTESEELYQTNLQAYEEGKAAYEAGLAEYEAGVEQIRLLEALGPLLPEEQRAELEAAKLELEAARIQLEEAEAQLQSAQAQLAEGRAQLDQGWAELEQGQAELEAGWAAYYAGKAELEAAELELNAAEAAGRQELEAAEAELRNAETQYQSGLNDYYSGLATAQSEFAKAEAELLNGEQKLQDARKELAKLENPTVHTLDRSTNLGYVCFENDASIVEAISTVFPVFFFLVAALVCITTMTRMVDEQRTQIGTLKALGYSRATIMSKYLFYSGSASLIGSIFGVTVGSYVIPKIIWEGYKMMYTFAESRFYFSIPIAAFSVIGYLLCSTGATLLACSHELSEVPAELIRPKAPKNGKRIFLERIPAIWNHLSFLKKVSIRNVFRYKGRMFMMVLGIGGCTALILTGFGVKDSIQDVVNYQYDEITLYDYAVNFSEAQSETDYSQFLDHCGNSIADAVFLREMAVDVTNKDQVKSASLVISNTPLDSFVSLHQGDNTLPFPGRNEALINIGLAEALNLKIGDSLTLRDSDMREMTLVISGIFDNYVAHAIHISAETYTEQWKESPERNAAYVLKAETADVHETAARIMDIDDVTNVTVNADTRDRINTTLSSLNYIVLLIIVCAGALAFIVLYNLTNINITERIREIATIKVLGFNEMESATYVFRENLMLTAIGAAFGLVLGKLLHTFAMSCIKVDMMHFPMRILFPSYLYSIVLTFLFAIIVAVFMYFKLQKINMAEALKSVE